jgi:16S rRNA (uracil1498-N3)-methyltransferase
VERLDRPIVATFFADGGISGPEVILGDDSAHHARVKRLAAGDRVRLTDGVGTIAVGAVRTMTKASLAVAIERTEQVAPLPAIHLLVPVADRDRMLMLAEKCVELGVTTWQPVYFSRSRNVTPRGEGESFDRKLRARMQSALEQCGGAWLPLLRQPLDFEHALRVDAVTRVAFDAGGDSLPRLIVSAPTAAMIGPEGGYDSAERESIHAAGWRFARLEGNILRFETAGIAAAVLLRTMLASNPES